MRTFAPGGTNRQGKRGKAAALLLLLGLLGAAPAPNLLYTGQAIVTGTDERDRPRGLAACLDQVLINVSGDPNILQKPGIPALEQQAQSLLLGIDYHDRMSGLRKHDEQGTHDRPFTLTATFDPGKIQAALKTLGETPWPGPRPPVLLIVAVRGFTGNFTITPEENAADLMRDFIAAAAERYRLDVQLPASPDAAAPPGVMTLRGTLDWSDAAFGWVAHWQTGWNGRAATWGERGVSFDDAFRAALAGALGIASGHGPPHS